MIVMIAIGEILVDGDRLLTTLSVVPYQAEKADTKIVCQEVVLTDCEEISAKAYRRIGQKFTLPWSVLAPMKRISMKCADCVYRWEYELTINTLVRPPFIEWRCAIKQPPSEYEGFFPDCQRYRQKNSLGVKKTAEMLKELFEGYTLTRFSIEKDGHELPCLGRIGGVFDDEYEFEEQMEPFSDENVLIVLRYWDETMNDFNPRANAFVIARREFDYRFYLSVCTVFCSLFLFPESRAAVVSHCEGIYHLPWNGTAP